MIDISARFNSSPMIFYQIIHPLQDSLPGLRDAIAVHPKFDRESGVDCPNAILVLLLHIQELWMDILPLILVFSLVLNQDGKSLNVVMWLCAKKGLHFKCCKKG